MNFSNRDWFQYHAFKWIYLRLLKEKQDMLICFAEAVAITSDSRYDQADPELLSQWENRGYDFSDKFYFPGAFGYVEQPGRPTIEQQVERIKCES